MRDRLLVLGSGILLSLVGVLAVLNFAVPALFRAICVLAWVGFVVVEHGRITVAFNAATGFRLDQNLFLEVRDRSGRWQAAELAAGSIVLDRAVWLRYRNSGGRPGVELITGNGRSMHDFRRLKVLLLHAEAERNR